MKSRGISAVGAAGFCWGASVAVRLAKSDCIKSAVLLHPSFVTHDDIQEVQVPIAILGAEIDKYSPPVLLKEFEDILSSKFEIISLVKIFSGTQHGWTMRYDVEDEHATRNTEEAHQDMINWFTKYVKFEDV